MRIEYIRRAGLLAQRCHCTAATLAQKKIVNEGVLKSQHLLRCANDNDLAIGQHGDPGAELKNRVEVVRHHHHRQAHVPVHRAQQLMLAGIRIHIRLVRLVKQLAHNFMLLAEFQARFNTALECRPARRLQ